MRGARTGSKDAAGGGAPVSFEVLQALITGDGSADEVRALLSSASNKQVMTGAPDSLVVVVAQGGGCLVQALLTQREDGWTLFHTACNRGKLQVAFCLAEQVCYSVPARPLSSASMGAQGSDCNATTQNGSTGLHFLALLNRDGPSWLGWWCLAAHVAQNARPYLCFCSFWPSFFVKGHRCIWSPAAARRACMCVPCSLASSALRFTLGQMATSRKNEIAAGFFIEQGCDLNAQTKQGDTALHYAVAQNSAVLCGLLLDAGALLDIANAAGQTALDLAARSPPHIHEV